MLVARAMCAWELSESCVSQNSGSVETEQPSTGWGFGGVTPEKFWQLMGKSVF